MSRDGPAGSYRQRRKPYPRQLRDLFLSKFVATAAGWRSKVQGNLQQVLVPVQ
jgi:hypothetical protein